MKLLPSTTSSQTRGERLFVCLLRGMATLASGIVLLIFCFLISESVPVLTSVGPSRFVTDPAWHPREGQYNLLPMAAATLAVATGAILIAAPLGLLSAAFCRFFAPRWLAQGYRRMMELLAGIPSVVYGLWGLTALVPLLARIAPPGQSVLAGSLVLAVMILPTVALLVDAGFGNVPRESLEAAAALGLSPWCTVWNVVLPQVRSGVTTAVVLAVARAVGETMAVLMVCGNVVQLPRSIFDPVRPLTANIALELGYALGDHRSALFVSGLVLLVLVAMLVGCVEFADRERVHA